MFTSNNVSAPATPQQPGARTSDSPAAGGELGKRVQTEAPSTENKGAKQSKSDGKSPQDVLVGSSAGAGDRAGGRADDDAVVDRFTTEERRQFESYLTEPNVFCGYHTSVLEKTTEIISRFDELYHTVTAMNTLEDCFANVELIETFTKLAEHVGQLYKHLDFASKCSLTQFWQTHEYILLCNNIRRENSHITNQGKRDRLTSERVHAHCNAQCLLFLLDLMEQSHVDSSGSRILVVDVNGEPIEDPNFRTKFEQLLLKIYSSGGDFFELPTCTNDMAIVLRECLKCLKTQATNRFMVHNMRFN